MTITRIDETYVKLTSDKHIKDIRTQMIHSEVICNEKDVKYFKEVD